MGGPPANLGRYGGHSAKPHGAGRRHYKSAAQASAGQCFGPVDYLVGAIAQIAQNEMKPVDVA